MIINLLSPFALAVPDLMGTKKISDHGENSGIFNPRRKSLG
jgi:hypothetical protein